MSNDDTRNPADTAPADTAPAEHQNPLQLFDQKQKMIAHEIVALLADHAVQMYEAHNILQRVQGLLRHTPVVRLSEDCCG